MRGMGGTGGAGGTGAAQSAVVCTEAPAQGSEGLAMAVADGAGGLPWCACGGSLRDGVWQAASNSRLADASSPGNQRGGRGKRDLVMGELSEWR